MTKTTWYAASLICLLLLFPIVAQAQFMPQPAGMDPNAPPVTFQPPANFSLDNTVQQPFQPVDANGNVCPVGSGIASRIVTCIHDTAFWAITAFLLPFSALIGKTVAVACTLAVILFGLRVATGSVQRVPAETLILGLKLGGVMVFTWNFGNFFPSIIAIMNDLVTSVTTYVVYSDTLACPLSQDVWQRVDCGLNRIVGGILPGSSLASGVIGFMVGCIFSGPVGFSIFLMGMAFFFIMLLALFRAIYIYIMAFIAICLLVCVSPLIIPMMLFQVTQRYFQHWLRLLFGLMLQPVFMFAFLSMMLAAMDIVVFSGPQSLYVMIAGPQAMQPGFQIGPYLSGSGAYVRRDELPVSVNLDPRELAQDLGLPGGLFDTGFGGNMMLWSQGLGAEANEMINRNVGATVRVQAVDMQMLANAQGLTLTQYIVKVMMGLLTAAVMAYIFYVMMNTVPYIAAALGGAEMNRPGILAMPLLSEKLESGMSGLRDRMMNRQPGTGR